MTTYVNQQLAALASVSDRNALLPLLNARPIGSPPLRPLPLALSSKAGGGTLAKTGSAAFSGIANGVPVTILSSTDITGADRHHHHGGQIQRRVLLH